MRVLIDECAPKALKVALAASGFDCTTVQEAGWSGKENGELLALADASFDVVVTIDRNLRYRAEPHRAQDRAADRAFAFEPCGGFRAALLRLRRGVANHSTGHSRRGGVLGVGVLGEAAGPFFRWRVYRAREAIQASRTCPSNYLAFRRIPNVAREQRQSARRVPGAKKTLAGVAAGIGNCVGVVGAAI
jgi:PIN like domain